MAYLFEEVSGPRSLQNLDSKCQPFAPSLSGAHSRLFKTSVDEGHCGGGDPGMLDSCILGPRSQFVIQGSHVILDSLFRAGVCNSGELILNKMPEGVGTQGSHVYCSHNPLFDVSVHLPRSVGLL